ncbi:hypothetical protein EN830_33660, partial [Mesorhizobium sp. M1C.F.Ca.ET.187.01.1.1]
MCPSMLNSITACDLSIAASCPAESAACSFCAVMSVASIFSYLKTFRRHADRVLPERGQVTMTQPFL